MVVKKTITSKNKKKTAVTKKTSSKSKTEKRTKVSAVKTKEKKARVANSKKTSTTKKVVAKKKSEKTKKTTTKTVKAAKSRITVRSTAVRSAKKTTRRTIKTTKNQNSNSRVLVVADGPTAFWTVDGQVLDSLITLKSAFDEMSKKVYDYHAKGESNDFAQWVELVLNDPVCAEDLRKSRTAKSASKVIKVHLQFYKF